MARIFSEPITVITLLMSHEPSLSQVLFSLVALAAIKCSSAFDEKSGLAINSLVMTAAKGFVPD